MANVVDTVKIIYDLAMKGKTLELQEKLMQLREQALELQEENFRLREENGKLKERVELKETMKFKRKVYFRDDDEIPFCAYCYDRHQLLIHLSGPEPNPGARGHLYTCQECSTTYWTDGEEDFTVWKVV